MSYSLNLFRIQILNFFQLDTLKNTEKYLSVYYTYCKSPVVGEPSHGDEERWDLGEHLPHSLVPGSTTLSPNILYARSSDILPLVRKFCYYIFNIELVYAVGMCYKKKLNHNSKAETSSKQSIYNFCKII